MLKERKDWIVQFLSMNEFKKAPEKAEDFYEKDKVMMPLSEEE